MKRDLFHRPISARLAQPELLPRPASSRCGLGVVDVRRQPLVLSLCFPPFFATDLRTLLSRGRKHVRELAQVVVGGAAQQQTSQTSTRDRWTDGVM